MDQENIVFLQAWHAYEEIRRIVERTAAGLDNIVKTNIYVTNAADLAFIERAGNYFFKNGAPVETIIPVSEIGMFKELAVEIEPIIVMDQSA